MKSTCLAVASGGARMGRPFTVASSSAAQAIARWDIPERASARARAREVTRVEVSRRPSSPPPRRHSSRLLWAGMIQRDTYSHEGWLRCLMGSLPTSFPGFPLKSPHRPRRTPLRGSKTRMDSSEPTKDTSSPESGLVTTSCPPLRDTRSPLGVAAGTSTPRQSIDACPPSRRITCGPFRTATRQFQLTCPLPHWYAETASL